MERLKLEFIFGFKLFAFGLLLYFAGIVLSSPLSFFDKGIFFALLGFFVDAFVFKYSLLFAIPIFLSLLLYESVPKISLWVCSISIFMATLPISLAVIVGFHVYGMLFFMVTSGFFVSVFAFSFLFSSLIFLLKILIKIKLEKYEKISL